jgi:aspartate aminotransferase-like enzyme
MSASKWPYRLLAPGPVPVPTQVLQAMSHKVLHHRTPEFERILRDTWAGLSWVFGTKQPVQIIAGTGSAAMEAAVVNLLSPGDEALVVVSGKFGERWADMCERFGIVTHRWNLKWGEPADLQQFEQQLKTHSKVKAVFTEVCETSTATVHPIEAMAKLVRQHTQALFAVDAITAVGCMPLPMDQWDLDVVVAGSQKAFSIPTGLSFIALSERAWTAQAQSKCPKFYFDLAAEKKVNAKGETYFSTPTSLMVGLHVVLKRWREVGLEQMIKRCATLAQATRDMAPALGLCVYSLSPSNSVTALAVPAAVDSAKVRDWLERERNITIMGGQDHLKGKILRIGHMGDVRDEDMLALFDALAEHFSESYDQNSVRATLSQARPLFT